MTSVSVLVISTMLASVEMPAFYFTLQSDCERVRETIAQLEQPNQFIDTRCERMVVYGVTDLLPNPGDQQ